MADEARPMRGCDVCGKVDTDPRHVFAYAVGDGSTDSEIAVKMIEGAKRTGDAATIEAVVTHIQDSSTIMRHMDCCREAGCPDGTCDQVTKGAKTLRGDDLLAHLTKEK
jgi:hypothetical protein